jgi:hypothetical protein
LAHHVQALVAHEIKRAGDEIVQRRSRAPIGHVDDVEAGLLTQQHAGQMGGGACARRAVIQRARMRARIADEILQRRDRQAFAHDDVMRRDGQHADGREILDRIVMGRGIQRRTRDMRRHVVHQHRVAIGGRARRTHGAGRAARAGDVFDHEGLAERTREIFAVDARRDIGWSAGRERDHDRHGLQRIGLREHPRPERKLTCERDKAPCDHWNASGAMQPGTFVPGTTEA